MQPTLVLNILLSASSVLISAQQPRFLALRDSLARVEDTALIRRLEAQRIPARNAAVGKLVEQGLIALRMYDLTADPAASKRARQAFEAAVRKDASDGWAQLGLGMALASSPDAIPSNEGGRRGSVVLDDVVRKLTGTDARSRARHAFGAALAAMPPIDRAARELGALALMTRSAENLEDARRALEALARRGNAQSEDDLALAAVLTALGQNSAALAAADRAVAALRSPAALYAGAIARLGLAGREAEGLAQLQEAVRGAEPPLLQSMYRALLPVVSAAEQVRWRSGDVSSRRDFLVRFWEVRAALGGVSMAQRAAEHFRRLAQAERRFQRSKEFGAPELNWLRWQPAQERSRFDDRGDIYVRHGEPAHLVRTHGPDQALNESWIYIRPDRSVRMYHFIDIGGEYALPYAIPCDQDFLGDRAQFDPRLAGLSFRCDGLNGAAYSANMREMAWEGLETDTRFPNFTRELPFLYDLYTFRGSPGKTTVVAAFAVPASALETSDQAGKVRYRFDLSLILADTAAHTVSRTDDSSSVVVARALDGADMLRAHLEVQVPPSSTTLQRVIVTDPTSPGIGQLYGGPFPIPDYSGSQLMISDIALGQVNAPRGWKRGDITLGLTPTNQFNRGAFSMFYEIYNLKAGNRFTTEVLIDRLNRSAGSKLKDLFGGDKGVRFKFDGESTADAGGTLRELRAIQAELGKGRYRMTVTVKDLETGQSAKASRQFIIPG